MILTNRQNNERLKEKTSLSELKIKQINTLHMKHTTKIHWARKSQKTHHITISFFKPLNIAANKAKCQKQITARKLSSNSQLIKPFIPAPPKYQRLKPKKNNIKGKAREMGNIKTENEKPQEMDISLIKY